MNDSPTKERMAEDDKKRVEALGWLVLVLSIGAFVLSVTTKGLSLIVLPLITAIVVGRATGRRLAWCFGDFYCAACLLFGLVGVMTFPVAFLGTSMLMYVLNRAMGKVLFVMTFLSVLFVGEPSSTTQVARRAMDSSNVRQISVGLQAYHTRNAVYPYRLSRLEKFVGNTRAFASPRGAGEKRWFSIGPLNMWFRRHNPGPVRQIQHWAEVDDGDYLYRQPSATAASNTIVLMTRPGLLTHNGVNIGYFDGSVAYAREQEWKNRQDVIDFLRDLNLTNYLSLIINE